MREEDGPQGSGSSAPPANKESQGEQDTTTCREQNWDSPPTPSSSQPHRRKFPLVPSRRGIPLISPPAPWIGRSITVEEHYQEKQAQSQWLKRIFEDKTATTSDFGAMTQTTSSGGSTTSSHYISRVSAGPAGSGDFGISMSAPHNSSTTGAFDFVAGRSGRTGGTAHFWGCLSQNSLGTAGQSTLFAIYVASTPQKTSVLAAITSGFGAVTQPTSCGTRTSGFGSTVSAPFTSMVSAGPTGSGGFGTRVPAPHSSPTTGAFGCGSGQSGRSGLKNPFWGALKPSSLDGAGQSTPSAFHVASTPQNTPGFAAITSGFGAVTQPTSCGTRTSGFASTVSAPVTSMVSAGPTGSGGFGTRVPAPHSSPTTGAFGCGSGQSGRSGLKNPFWGALKPSSLDGAGQSTPSAFHVASTPQNTPGFAAITSAFAAMTLTTSSGTSRSVVGSTTLSPIISGVSAGPAGSGGFVISMAAPNSSSTIGSFGFGSGRSGRTGLKNPFWGALNENCLGAAGQSTPSPIHMASTPQDTSGIAAITSAFAAMTLTSSSRTSTTGFGSTISVPFTSRV
nr:nuclear envelope pore membrane protein POM 121C-like isoform X1 [Manis javanica]